MKTKSLKEKIELVIPELKEELKLKNEMALPVIKKVVIAVGTGRGREQKKNELVADRLLKITGQKASPCPARKSIANFKLRQGEIIGQKVTLRGPRMFDFLDRLLNIAIPRIRDFKGLELSGVDQMGNLTIGIKEHTVFPETADEDLRDIFSLAITITTSAKNKKIAEVFFKQLGFPFKRV